MSDDGDTASPATTAGEATAATPAGGETLGFAATVADQPTDEHPARVVVSVTNESSAAWTYPVWRPDVAATTASPSTTSSHPAPQAVGVRSTGVEVSVPTPDG